MSSLRARQLAEEFTLRLVEGGIGAVVGVADDVYNRDVPARKRPTLDPANVHTIPVEAPTVADDVPDVELHELLVEAVRAGLVGVDDDGRVTANASIVSHPRCDEIEQAIGTIGGRVAALRAAGFNMAPVPPELRDRARQLVGVLELVAGSNEAPVEFISIVEQAVDAMLRRGAPQAAAWHAVLVGIIASTIDLRLPVADKRRRAKGIASEILAKLRRSTTDIPRALERLDAKTLRAADVMLGDLVVAERGHRGGAVSPWGAAKRLCEIFGVPMPRKLADASRSRKSASRP